ncbi:MAG TPA: sulfotransferase [Candidatus Paceibacterota bacterium]|nr:sulfotransferase [Candidatus Paceibacterota bacterium]
MEKVPALFILGFGHSGSTLLDLLLDGHSRLMGVGEIELATDESICTCGKRARECHVWKEALGPSPAPRREVYRSKWDFLFNRGPFRAGSTHQIIDQKEFTDATLFTMRTVLKETGKTIIVDSSAQTDRADLLSRSPDIEPMYVQLVRDGRGATWSFIRKYQHIYPFIVMWCAGNLKLSLFLRRARGKKLFMRYEDLVREPEQQLRRICDMLGVPFEPRMLNFRENEHHQVEGNRTRFGKDPIRIDDKWRRDMPLYQRALFNLLFGWLNLYYRFRSE